MLVKETRREPRKEWCEFMQDYLQITFRGVEQSDAIESRIRTKVAWLERFGQTITSCRVTVDAPHQHHNKGGLYLVSIDLHVAGAEIVVNKEHRNDHAHEDVNAAVRDAFDAAARQLEDHARKQRGEVKRHDAQI
jgi:ribosomal subunit interface protein